MEFTLLNEYQIDQKTSTQINALLKKCFSDAEYAGRDYFKQLPHLRLLAIENGQVIGQLGIDHRVMNLNDEAVRIFGVIDLCVDPEFRGQGIGSTLLTELESLAKKHVAKIDFLFLVTDTPAIYRNHGFKTTNVETQWLKIDQHNTLGVGTEKIQDAYFMVKEISGKQWKDGRLDMLGYMY